MKKLALSLAIFLAFTMPAAAAVTYTTITGSAVLDPGGNPLQAGKIIFTPGDNNGNPLTSVGVFYRSVTCSVSIGVIGTQPGGAACKVADALAANPNLCYKISLFDSIQNTTIPTPGQICAQPTGTTWSYDAYVPNQAGATLVQSGPQGPAGPAGAAGAAGPNCSISSPPGECDVTGTMQASAYTLGPLSNQTFVFGLDSLTYGVGAPGGSDYPTQAMAMSFFHSRGTKVNLGIPGQTCATALTNYSSTYHTYAPTAGQVAYAIIQGGHNDIGTSGTSGADTFTCISSLWADLKADGFIVVAETIPPGALTETERRSFNALVRAANGTGVYDYLFDVGASFADPSDTTYYYTDGVHFNASGYHYWACGLNAALAGSVPCVPPASAATADRVIPPYNVESGNYTVAASDKTIALTGTSQTLTLPQMPLTAGPFFVYNAGSTDATIAYGSGASGNNVPAKIAAGSSLTLFVSQTHWVGLGYGTTTPKYNFKSASYSLALSDQIVGMNGTGLTLTLPNLGQNVGPIMAFNTGTDAIAIATSSSSKFGVGAALPGNSAIVFFGAVCGGSYCWIGVGASGNAPSYDFQTANYAPTISDNIVSMQGSGLAVTLNSLSQNVGPMLLLNIGSNDLTITAGTGVSFHDVPGTLAVGEALALWGASGGATYHWMGVGGHAAIGYTAQSGSYAPTTADFIVEMNGSTAQTLTLNTLPRNTGPILVLNNNTASNPLTVTAGGGATLSNVPATVPVGSSILMYVGHAGVEWIGDGIASTPAVTAVQAFPVSDLLCSKGNDATIGLDTITGATNADPVVFTVSTNPQNLGYLSGQPFNVATVVDAGANSNFNGTYAVTAVSSTTVTASCTTGCVKPPGSAYSSAGTTNMICSNSADAVPTALQPLATTLSLPAFSGATRYNIEIQGGQWTPTTAPAMTIPELFYGSSTLTTQNGTVTLRNADVNISANAKYSLMSPFSGVLYPALSSQAFGATGLNSNLFSTIYATTSGAQTLSAKMSWAAAGVGGTITYVSGASGCTNGTQVVSFTNGAGTGGAGTITVSGGVPTGTVTITNTGYAYTSNPTAGTIATCTGTATFSGGTLGGVQGTAFRTMYFGAKAQ